MMELVLGASILPVPLQKTLCEMWEACGDVKCLLALVQRDDLDVEVVTRLAYNKEIEIRAAACRRQELPAEVALDIARIETATEVLASLVQRGDARVAEVLLERQVALGILLVSEHHDTENRGQVPEMLLGDAVRRKAAVLLSRRSEKVPQVQLALSRDPSVATALLLDDCKPMFIDAVVQCRGVDVGFEPALVNWLHNAVDATPATPHATAVALAATCVLESTHATMPVVNAVRNLERGLRSRLDVAGGKDRAEAARQRENLAKIVHLLAVCDQFPLEDVASQVATSTKDTARQLADRLLHDDRNHLAWWGLEELVRRDSFTLDTLVELGETWPGWLLAVRRLAAQSSLVDVQAAAVVSASGPPESAAVQNEVVAWFVRNEVPMPNTVARLLANRFCKLDHLLQFPAEILTQSTGMWTQPLGSSEADREHFLGILTGLLTELDTTTMLHVNTMAATFPGTVGDLVKTCKAVAR